MPKMKYWNGSAWIPLDAADADTVDGKHASDFAPATHVGQGGAAHALANSTTAGFMSASDFNKLAGIQPGAEVNQNAFTTIKVGATNIDADSKTDTLELAAGTGITLTPDSVNDKVTIAVNATSAGGTEANRIAMTNSSGRVGDSEKVGGKTLSDLDNRYVPLAISSETQPATPKEGMLWYKPSTDETKAYLNGAFRPIGATINGVLISEITGTTTLSSPSSTVTIPVPYNPSGGDILHVYQNSTYIHKGRDYTVNGNQIVSTGDPWQAGTVFDFVVFGAATAPNQDTMTLAMFEGSYTATGGETTIPITVPQYNADTDILMVFHENLELFKGDNYNLNANKTSIDLVGYTAGAGDKFYFKVIKKVRDQYTGSIDGTAILDGTVTNAKLHADIKIGSLAALTTTNKSDIVSAINEVNAKSGPASNVSITDSGNYYTSTNVEGALQEIGQVLNAMRGELITSVNNILNM